MSWSDAARAAALEARRRKHGSAHRVSGVSRSQFSSYLQTERAKLMGLPRKQANKAAMKAARKSALGHLRREASFNRKYRKVGGL